MSADTNGSDSGAGTRVRPPRGGGNGNGADIDWKAADALIAAALGTPRRVPKCPIGAEVTTSVVDQVPAGLSVAQFHAIELLLRGTSVQLIAKTCGVNRRTIHRWRTEDPTFRAELERAREEVWADSIERMRILVSRSLDVLDEQLDDDYDRARVRAAGMVLNHSGLRKLMQGGAAAAKE